MVPGIFWESSIDAQSKQPRHIKKKSKRKSKRTLKLKKRVLRKKRRPRQKAKKRAQKKLVHLAKTRVPVPTFKIPEKKAPKEVQEIVEVAEQSSYSLEQVAEKEMNDEFIEADEIVSKNTKENNSPGLENYFKRQADFFVEYPQEAANYLGDRLLIYIPLLGKMQKLIEQQTYPVSSEQRKRIVNQLKNLEKIILFTLSRCKQYLDKIDANVLSRPYDQVRRAQAQDSLKLLLLTKIASEDDRTMVGQLFNQACQEEKS